MASFTYDYQGRRKSKTTADGTIYYHYGVLGRVLYETDENNELLAYYGYGPDNKPAYMMKNEIRHYFHYNGHGDVSYIVDEEGNIVTEYSYDAWGNILSATGPIAEENEIRYAGYRYDEETGLYYLRSRYYDPEIGRFIKKDTIPKINHYAYARNNRVPS